MRLNWFLDMWYVPCKLCNYLASRLALYPNRPKSLHLSLFNYEYHQVRLKWFLSLWCIRRKPCTYLLPKLTLSLNEPNQDSIWHIIKELYQVRPNWFVSISFVPCKPCTYLALSLNRPNRASTWESSFRGTNRCFQNGLLYFGALGTNRAHILHRN